LLLTRRMARAPVFAPGAQPSVGSRSNSCFRSLRASALRKGHVRETLFVLPSLRQKVASGDRHMADDTLWSAPRPGAHCFGERAQQPRLCKLDNEIEQKEAERDKFCWGIDTVSTVYQAIGDRSHFAPTAEEVEQDPSKRRFWLLQQAVRSVSSLAEALKIAEQAEEFVVVGTISRSSDPANKVAAAPLETTRDTPSAVSQAALSSLLEPDKKAAISARLEAGATNAELAPEFGLTPHQVQGFRMQVARRRKRKIAAIQQQRQAAARRRYL